MVNPFARVLKSMIRPAAVKNNASYATTSVDTSGYDYAVVVVDMGATDIALSALKVQESDDNSTWVDITNTVMGTADNDTGSASTLPSATDDNNFFSFFIDLRGRQRYLSLVATVGNGTTGAYVVAHCELWRTKETPQTAVAAGYAQRMIA